MSMASKKEKDNIESFTREYLRRIDKKLDRLNDDMRDLKFRIRQVESTLANHTAQLANHTAQLVYQTGQFDRLFSDIEIIKKRLDLVDA